MIEVIAILVIVFVALLVMDVPIAVAIAVSAMLAMLLEGYDPNLMVASKLANGIDSFTLLAIPFFILSGILMGRGGMARRLMDFASTLIGRFPGGLAYVNTLTCMLFGSISGSAAAAVTSIGGFMLPEMKNKGYNNEFSVSVTTTAATTGLLIPPSNIMIVYAVASGTVSIAAMFMAGILPGVLIGLLLMAVCYIIAKRTNLSPGKSASLGQIWTAFRHAFLSMLLLVIVIGGILKGIFTATEASSSRLPMPLP